MQAVGDILASGTWSPKTEAPLARSLDELLRDARHKQRHKILSIPKQHAKELWSSVRTLAESGKLDIVRGADAQEVVANVRSLVGDFVHVPFFGVPQDNKVRGCPGASSAGLTAGTRLNEKMHMLGIDGVTALVRAAAAAHPTSQLKISKVFWKYRLHRATAVSSSHF